MSDHAPRGVDDTADAEVKRVVDAARAAEGAVQELCRATLHRPGMAPADVDIALAALTEMVAALPQAVRQLGDILENAKDQQRLEMDEMSDTPDPGIAIDATRLHLDAAAGAALASYRSLDAAHQQTAHIAVTNHEDDHGSGPDHTAHRHSEEREPPSRGPADHDCGPSR